MCTCTVHECAGVCIHARDHTLTRADACVHALDVTAAELEAAASGFLDYLSVPCWLLSGSYISAGVVGMGKLYYIF